MQHRSEPDVYRIGKDLPREHSLTLSEEVIKHHRDRAFLENADKNSRADFVAFDEHIKTNIPELEGTSCAPTSSSSGGVPVQLARLAPLASSTGRSSPSGRPRQHAFVMRQTPVPPMTCSVSSRLADLLGLRDIFGKPRHNQNSARPARARVQRPSKAHNDRRARVQ